LRSSATGLVDLGTYIEIVPSGDAGSLYLILSLVFLRPSYHSLNLLLGETALVLGNGNGFDLSGTFLRGGHIDTADVDIEAAVFLRACKISIVF
jgi:hypothetical protein